MKNRPITIVLAEDHLIVREGLRTLLKLRDEFKVIGEASTGQEAVELARTLHPDIVIMDLAMPILNGIEATRQIKLEAPECKILILSAHSDDEYVERLLALGANGYLVKQNSGQILLQAIPAIMSGQTYLSQSIATRMRQQTEQSRMRGEKGSTRRALTLRETEVLQMVAEGSANKQIALQLKISIKTVEKHRQQLMDKLNIHQTAGLTRYAIDSGMIESSIQARDCPKYESTPDKAVHTQ